jgi:WD40 repeat protein
VGGFNDEESAPKFRGVTQAYYLKDGKRLVTRTEHSLTIWNAERNFEKIRTIVCPQGLRILASSFKSNRLLMTDSKADGNISIWDTETGEWLYTLAHQNFPHRCQFFPADGERFVVGNNGMVRIWHRRRPEYRAGVLMLPEFWLTALLVCAFVWSLFRDIGDIRDISSAKSSDRAES